MYNIYKKAIHDDPSVTKKIKTFRLGDREINFGTYNNLHSQSLFLETVRQKGKYIHVKRNILQCIKLGDKIRLAYHTQKKTMKKVEDGE